MNKIVSFLILLCAILMPAIATAFDSCGYCIELSALCNDNKNGGWQKLSRGLLSSWPSATPVPPDRAVTWSPKVVLCENQNPDWTPAIRSEHVCIGSITRLSEETFSSVMKGYSGETHFKSDSPPSLAICDGKLVPIKEFIQLSTTEKVTEVLTRISNQVTPDKVKEYINSSLASQLADTKKAWVQDTAEEVVRIIRAQPNDAAATK